MTSNGGAGHLAMNFERMSPAASDQPPVERMLREIADLAARTVEGAVSAGISVIGGDNRLTTCAYTDELALKVDEAQSRLHEGPGLSAAQSGEALIRIDDMSEERRWPCFAGEAARLGVGNMITCGLPTKHDGGVPSY